MTINVQRFREPRFQTPRIVAMSQRSNNSSRGYKHVEHVQWPDELPDPDYWKPNFTTNLGWPEEIRAMIGRVTESGVQFCQKVKQQQTPITSGDENDPDAIHALLFTIDRLGELATALEQRSRLEYGMMSVVRWLLERQDSLFWSMQAVVIAEEGELYDSAGEKVWKTKSVEMVRDHFDRLKFIFRGVMARIDIAPARNWDNELIQPNHKEVIVQHSLGKVCFPPAPSTSFWEMDHSMMDKSSSEMRRAVAALLNQGRVLSTGRNNITATEQKPFPPVFEVTMRATELVIRIIDTVWQDRPHYQPKAVEERLFAWLRERKNVAVDFRIAFLAFLIPLEFYEQTIKIDSSGKMYVLENGVYLEWTTLFLV